jgi:hypothetical protein
MDMPIHDNSVLALTMNTVLDRLAISIIKVRQLQRRQIVERTMTSAQFDDALTQIERQVRELNSILSTLRNRAPVIH